MSYGSVCYDVVCLWVCCSCLVSVCVLFATYCVAWPAFLFMGACVCVCDVVCLWVWCSVNLMCVVLFCL